LSHRGKVIGPAVSEGAVTLAARISRNFGEIAREPDEPAATYNGLLRRRWGPHTSNDDEVKDGQA
jgi:hypothetical protein